MANDDDRLAVPPPEGRSQELWLQHVAGFILLRDVRGYAREQLDPDLDASVREVAFQAIDDALYGVMMVADGVAGVLENDGRSVRIAITAQLQTDEKAVAKLDLAEGDGMCMGYHGWLEGDFGKHPIVEA